MLFVRYIVTLVMEVLCIPKFLEFCLKHVHGGIFENVTF